MTKVYVNPTAQPWAWHSVTHTGTDYGEDRQGGNPVPNGYLPVEGHTGPPVEPGYRARFGGWTVEPDRVVGGWTVEQRPQPWPSWTWVEGEGWVPPVPKPDGGVWEWDEDGQAWVEIEEDVDGN